MQKNSKKLFTILQVLYKIGTNVEKYQKTQENAF